MNGTMDIGDKLVATVYAHINDYDRAVAIYEGLRERLAPYYSDLHESQEGTRWEVNSNDRGFRTILNLQKYDNGYRIYATMRYNHSNKE